MSMCRVVSCVVGRRCLLWPAHSLGKSLLAFYLLHFVLQGQICLLLQVFIDFLLLHSSPYNEKNIFFWVLVLEAFVGLHRTFNFSFFSITDWGIDLDYSGIEWFTLETNKIILSFLSLHPRTAFDSFVDFYGYSISSKGFLPTVIDIMVIWVKFTHSSSF